MITDLEFFAGRLELAGENGMMINRVRAQDRTVNLIKKYLALSKSLPQTRQATISNCEAVEGKGGIISLRVVDRPGFEALQSEIKAQSEELAACEAAIMELDKLAAGGELWYSDLETSVGSNGRTEIGENQRLSNLASATLARKVHSGKPADQILAEDDEYQRLSKIAKEQIDIANKQLETLRPKLNELTRLLALVGC
jgi:hypothetical protein